MRLYATTPSIYKVHAEDLQLTVLQMHPGIYIDLMRYIKIPRWLPIAMCDDLQSVFLLEHQLNKCSDSARIELDCK